MKKNNLSFRSLENSPIIILPLFETFQGDPLFFCFFRMGLSSMARALTLEPMGRQGKGNV